MGGMDFYTILFPNTRHDKMTTYRIEVMTMLKITRVGALDGNTIDVELDNGNILLVNLGLLAAEEGFGAMIKDNRILYPKTDGSSVYWRDGPRLTLADIFELIQRTGQTREE